MDYDCSLMPFDKLSVTPYGMTQPLCNDCLAPDCTNPIYEQTVSVMGVPKKMRLYVVNNVVKQVVSCAGYIGKTNAAIPNPQKIIESPGRSTTENNETNQSNNTTHNDENEVPK